MVLAFVDANALVSPVPRTLLFQAAPYPEHGFHLTYSPFVEAEAERHQKAQHVKRLLVVMHVSSLWGLGQVDDGRRWRIEGVAGDHWPVLGEPGGLVEAARTGVFGQHVQMGHPVRAAAQFVAQECASDSPAPAVGANAQIGDVQDARVELAERGEMTAVHVPEGWVGTHRGQARALRMIERDDDADKLLSLHSHADVAVAE